MITLNHILRLSKIGLLLAVLLCMVVPRLNASHYYGSTMAYECRGNDTIRIWWHGYRDCLAAPTFPAPTLTITPVGSGCIAPTALGGWILSGVQDITPIAPHEMSECDMPGSPHPGVEQFSYYRDYSFGTGNCPLWVFSWSDCCFSNNIMNIPGGSTYYEQVDTVNLFTCNNSPVWRTHPVVYLPAGTASLFDQGAVDPDGDSLVYSLEAPMTAAGTPAAYNPGYSVLQPFGPSWNVSLDPATGWLSFQPTPGNMVMVVFVVAVTEYRAGLPIGKVRREMLTVVMPSAWCTSTPPDFTGLTNLQNCVPLGTSGDSISAPPSTPICLDVATFEPNAGHAHNLTWMGDLPGAVFSDTNGTPMDTILGLDPYGRLCWTTPAAPGVYTTTFAVLDTGCNTFSMVPHTYTIVVGDTAPVWPGDANDDNIADYLDLFSVGFGFGSTGPARASMSNLWQAYPSMTWLDTVPGPVDKKHADCDGSGLIDADDTLAITLNYGLTHTKGRVPLRATGSNAPLRFEIDADSADVGDTITASIFLGDSLLAANNVYGVGFSLAYDAALIDSSTFSIVFVPSWIGNSLTTLELDHNFPSLAVCDAAQVRTTHTAVSGMGQIATAHFIIIDNIDGKRAQLDSALARFYFTNVRIVGLNGESIPVDPFGDSLMVYQLSVERPLPNPVNAPRVFPVPSSGFVKVEASGHALQHMEVYDLRGRKLADMAGDGRETQRLDLADLPAGMYLLRMETSQGIYTQRIVLE